MNTKKTYVLDTNVLISDPESIYSFEENDVVIPMAVIKELDNLKVRPGEVGQNSRLVSRRLNEYRSKYPGEMSKNGVVIHESREESGTLRIMSVTETDSQLYKSLGLSHEIVDDQIIMTAIVVKSLIEQTVFVSNDFNVLLKAEHAGLKCEEYRNIRISETSKMYSGIIEISVIDNKSISDLYAGFGVNEKNIVDFDNLNFYSNQYIIAKSHDSSFIGRFKNKLGETLFIDPLQKESNEPVFGLNALNKEQRFSIDALLNDDIKLVTLSGPSGCVDPSTTVKIRLKNTNWNIPIPDKSYLINDENYEDT